MTTHSTSTPGDTTSPQQGTATNSEKPRIIIIGAGIAGKLTPHGKAAGVFHFLVLTHLLALLNRVIFFDCCYLKAVCCGTQIH